MYSINKEGVLQDKEKSNTKLDTQDSQKNTMQFKQINLHSKQILANMIKDNIPPTPANFSIYFDKLLDDKSHTQKQNISNILELEEVEDYDYVSKIENNIQESFENIKEMMTSVSSVYSKVNNLITITKDKRRELTKSSNKIALASFDEDLAQINQDLSKYQRSIKDQYSNINTIMKNFNNESIFDKKYDVYNKKYLLNSIEAEKKSIENFNHESIILALKIKDISLRSVRLSRDKDLITKTVGKMILKRSRRNDIIAHLENGIFIILLKHTDEKQANLTIDRIDNMISLSNYIVDSQSIEVELDFALSKIDSTKTKEQIVAQALEKLPNK